MSNASDPTLPKIEIDDQPSLLERGPRTAAERRVAKTLAERFADELGARPLAPLAPAARVRQSQSQSLGQAFAAGPLVERIEDLKHPELSERVEQAVEDVEPRKTRHHVELNLPQLRRLGYITPSSDRSTIIEEFRTIKRPLLRNALNGRRNPDSLAHVILVSSAVAHEGKTFCAINLAMSMALERGLNVLLVDADVVKQDIPRRLGFKAKAGFLNVLSEPETYQLPDVLVRTNIPSLTILPAGTEDQNTTELLAGPEMMALIRDLANRYKDRIIVIDTPPVLMTTEAPVIASLVGQVALVVEAEKTTRQQVLRALDLLSTCGNINLILNKVKDIHSGEYHTYGYYKGRSGDASPEAATSGPADPAPGDMAPSEPAKP